MPLDDAYYSGNIASRNSDGHSVVNYNDGDVETLDFGTETRPTYNVLRSRLSGFLSVQTNSPKS